MAMHSAALLGGAESETSCIFDCASLTSDFGEEECAWIYAIGRGDFGFGLGVNVRSQTQRLNYTTASDFLLGDQISPRRRFGLAVLTSTFHNVFFLLFSSSRPSKL